MATETKEQGQPEAAHAERVDPAGRPSDNPSLQEVRREVEELQERVEQLAQAATPPPAPAPATPAVLSDPDMGPTPPAQHPLLEVLPQIKDLAQRVGGMKKLAEIVAMLAQSKE